LPWQEVQETCVVLVQLMVTPRPVFAPPENRPWQYVEAQEAEVALERVYVAGALPVLARVPSCTSATPFPSTCAASTTTLAVRAAWQASQATTAIPLVACAS
jgi:hypothetical protein